MTPAPKPFRAALSERLASPVARKKTGPKISETERRYGWAWESLEGDATFHLKAIFGGRGLYLRGQLMFFFLAGEEPWRGMCVCTAREHHASLRAAFPSLAPHPVLGKWLYLAEATTDFERDALRLAALARAGDPRIGVLPRPKKRRPPHESLF